jgi:hypothetical protein
MPTSHSVGICSNRVGGLVPEELGELVEKTVRPCGRRIENPTHDLLLAWSEISQVSRTDITEQAAQGSGGTRRVHWISFQ